MSLSERDCEHLRELEIRDEDELKKRKIVLALLRQCKDEGLSVSDVNDICIRARYHALKASLRDGLTITPKGP